jgi:hypothetical protein
MNDTYTVNGYPETPVLTEHARERCVQMHVRTREIKRLWRTRGVVRPLQGQDRVVVTSPEVPGYAAVMDVTGDKPVVVTVLFDEVEEYERDGNGGYRVVSE